MVAAGRRIETVARMVELRAVQPGFPLYGTLELDGGQTYSHALLQDHGVLVRPGAADGARLKVGDQIVIGKARVHDSRRDHERAGPPRRRLQPRSARADRLRRLAVDRTARRSAAAPGACCWSACRKSAIEPLVRRAARRLQDEFVNARSYRATDDEIGADFDRAENYLSLVGLVIVILGGIAVSSVTRVFVLQKMRSIAVLKCVGARSDQIIAVYLLQVLTLGLAGSLLGVVLARPTLAGDSARARRHRRRSWPTCDYGVTWSAALQGIGSRRARLAAVLGRAAAAGPLRQAVAAAARRDDARASATGRGSAVMVLVSAGAGGADRLAGGVAARRPVVCCRLLRAGGRAAGRRPAAGARDRAARQTPSFPLRHAVLHLSRPGQPDARRFCSRSASAPSSSSASGRCRPACSRSSRSRSRRTRRTCS